MAETQWMTLRETADMMKTLPDQVTRMCEDGKLEYYLEEGRYFVSRESIDLFMHPPIGEPAQANSDSNGTPRRQYGRAPHDVGPSPESASDPQAVRDPYEPAGGGGSATEDDMEETPGSGMEETRGIGEEVVKVAGEAQLAEGAQSVDDLVDSDHEETVEDLAETEDAQPVEDRAVTDHEETVESLVDEAEDLVDEAEDLVDEAEDAQPPETAEDPGEHADAVADPGEQVEAAAEPGEPDVRAAEILADLRAALTRHAREHKAFCDEIAALTDALESTFSQDDDKTSELTREISSLLARFTRR